MGVEDEVSVPVVRDLDPVPGSAVDAPVARGGGPGQRIEGELRFVDEVPRGGPAIASLGTAAMRANSAKNATTVLRCVIA